MAASENDYDELHTDYANPDAVYLAYDDDLCGGVRRTYRMDGTLVCYGIEWRDDDGDLHRDNDLPASVFTNGDQEWFSHGFRHRGGGLPAVVYIDSLYVWWENGKMTGTSINPPEGAVFPGQLTKPARAQ